MNGRTGGQQNTAAVTKSVKQKIDSGERRRTKQQTNERMVEEKQEAYSVTTNHHHHSTASACLPGLEEGKGVRTTVHEEHSSSQPVWKKTE